MRLIPERFRSQCSFCGDPLDIRAPGVFSLQTGWVKNRREGGGNALALKELSGHWACGLCIDKRTAGHAQYQPSLF